MSEHYFSKQPQVKSERMTWQTNLQGHLFSFTTDHGVFSREKIDTGSRLLIESFVEPDITGNILDLGCGYGPVGLAIAKNLPMRQVIMADINERAVSLAQHNMKQNAVTNAKVIVSDRFSAITGTFAAILLNPPIRAGKTVVYDLFAESYGALKKDGEFWVVIQKKQGAPSAAKKLEELFGNINLVRRKKGYHIYKMKKLD